MNRCIGRARHWRVMRGTVGMRAPVCVACGSPNPKPLTGEEWAEVLDRVKWQRENGFAVNRYVEAAIREREQRDVAAPVRKTDLAPAVRSALAHGPGHAPRTTLET